MRPLIPVALAPPRLVADLLLALPPVVRQLPGTVSEVRALVRELTRLAGSEGELTALLRETARLAAARADERPSG